MAQPYLALRTTRNGLFSHYSVAGSKNPLPLGMGSVKKSLMLLQMHLGELTVYSQKMSLEKEYIISMKC